MSCQKFVACHDYEHGPCFLSVDNKQWADEMVASCAGLNAEICNKKGKETLMTITVTHASFCFYLSGLRLTQNQNGLLSISKNRKSVKFSKLLI